jgi:aminopeptidase YwaD
MRIHRRTLSLAPALLTSIILFAGCSDGSPTTAAGSATPTPPATVAAEAPTAGSPAVAVAVDEPSAQRIMAHIESLAGEIGPRVAGTNSERAAADYIAEVLTESGYETTLHEFQYIDRYDESRVVLPGDEKVAAFMLAGSSSGNAHGRAVFGGTGQIHELADLRAEDSVLVLDRGVIPFADKVRNAQDAGARAVVIINHQPGPYRGTLGDLIASVPVLGVEQSAREVLVDVAGNGMLTVIAHGGRREQSSQNVVGIQGEECRAYLGAHYDSVPRSPGANDNASGVGLMLELARAYRVDGLCVIAFGAEEVGLWGSQAYVREHDLRGTAFMLNFDMVGKVMRPIVVGDEGLTAEIMEALAAIEDTPLRPGAFPPFASSDHVSFIAADVPAVTIHSGDDEHLHTPEDDLDNVDLESLETMLRASEVALLGLLRLHGIVGD